MKTSRFYFWMLLVGSVTGTHAQLPSADSLMQTVLEKNKTLRAAREANQVDILEAGTGNTPPDPELEFGYMFGTPTDMGNRVDFSVRQSLEFPTTYIHRSRLREIRSTRSELEYHISRQQVLFQAQQLWIERLHLNQLELLLSRRLLQAKTIHNHFREKLISGEVGQLALSQSTLQLASLQSEFEEVQSNIRSNRLALKEIAGGVEVEVSDTLYPNAIIINPDSMLQAYMEGPELERYRQELLLKEKQKDLAVSQNLPELSAGYYSETVVDQRFKGVQVGVTIPLWENANEIKRAKSEVLYAVADVERFAFEQRQEVLQKLDELESLQSRARQLEEALGDGDAMALLALALQSGEISMSEYFYASEFYFRNELQLLIYKRDQYLKEAELMRVYL
jgi:outer membrane protein TolC